MAPETKEVLDYLVTFLGPASVGGLMLALVGVWKAKAEKPHIAPPATTGPAAMAQIGGMVMAGQTAQDIIDAFRALASSHDRCTLAREAEMLARRKLWDEQQAHERKVAEERHDDHREMVDQVRTLNDRLRNVRVG